MSVYARRRWAATAVLVLVLVLVGVGKLVAMGTGESVPPAEPNPPARTSAGGDEEPPGALERTRVGSGARGATVIRQQGSAGGTVVILLHGWKVAGPGDYRDWAEHLAREGNTVILPRYQDRDTAPNRVFDNALRGIRSALDVVGEPEVLVAAGHSAGAALAADYAAGAAEANLPVPDGVLAIYPGRAILGYPGGIPVVDPSQIGPSTRLVVMSSPTDVVVGVEPAKQMFDTAINVPANRKRLISVTSSRAGDHYAPAGSSAAARRTFWAGLDRLLGRVQGGTGHLGEP